MLMFGAVIPARRRLVVVQLLTNEWSLVLAFTSILPGKMF